MRAIEMYSDDILSHNSSDEYECNRATVLSVLNTAIDQMPTLILPYRFGTPAHLVDREMYARVCANIEQLIPCSICAFYNKIEADNQFTVSYVTPNNKATILDDLFVTLVNERIIDWACHRSVPVVLEHEEGNEVLLQALTTVSGVRGIFVAVLKGNYVQIADCELTLFSIFINNLAATLDSYENVLTDRTGEGPQIAEIADHLDKDLRGDTSNENSGQNNDFSSRISGLQKLNIKENRININIKKNIKKINNDINIDSLINNKLYSMANFVSCLKDLKNPLITIKLNVQFIKKIFSSKKVENNLNKKKYSLNENYLETEIYDIFHEIDNSLNIVDTYINIFNEFYGNASPDTRSFFDTNNVITEVLEFTDKIFKDQFCYKLDLGKIPISLGYPSLIKDALLTILQILIVSFESIGRSKLNVSVITDKVENNIICIIDSNSNISEYADFVSGIIANFHNISPGDGIISAGHAIIQDVIVGKHGGGVQMNQSASGGTRVTIKLPIRECRY